MAISRLISAAWQSRRQIIKYFIVGISSVLLDLVSLIILKEVFRLNPVWAVSLNQILLIFYNFSLNKYWSFSSFSLPHRQFIRYLLLSGFDYLFSVCSMYLFYQQLGFDYRLVRLLAIALMVSWNFLLYKFWIYREPYGN